MPAHRRAAGWGLRVIITARAPSPFGLRRPRLIHPGLYIRINTTPPTTSMAPAIRITLTG
jgi:hypothetical protein